MRQEVEASTYKPPHTKRGRTTTNSPPNACSSYVKLYLGRPSKASKSLVLFCIFSIRRKSRTLVQKSVPGDTMIFVVRSDLKFSINRPLPFSSMTCDAVCHRCRGDAVDMEICAMVTIKEGTDRLFCWKHSNID